MIRKVLDFPKQILRESIQPGEVAIDATVGNGHDTVFLAQCVGGQGRVLGFDIQEAALRSTRRRLADEALMDRVSLFHESHAQMGRRVSEAAHGRAAAVMLGYLPGGDQRIVTRPETTCEALAAAWSLLRPAGHLSIVLYDGHPGGPEEAAAVDAWAAGLPQEQARVLSYQFVNQRNRPPRLVLVERRPNAAIGPGAPSLSSV